MTLNWLLTLLGRGPVILLRTTGSCFQVLRRQFFEVKYCVLTFLVITGAAKFYPLTEGISVNDSVHISLLSDGSSRLSLVQEKHKLNSLGNDLNKQRINSSVLSTEDDVHRRVWYGLEPHVGETPIMKACPGRTGLASVYTCESETFNINDKTSGEPESQE